MIRPKHLFRIVSFDVRLGALHVTVVWVELSGLELTTYLELVAFLVIKIRVRVGVRINNRV